MLSVLFFIISASSSRALLRTLGQCFCCYSRMTHASSKQVSHSWQIVLDIDTWSTFLNNISQFVSLLNLHLEPELTFVSINTENLHSVYRSLEIHNCALTSSPLPPLPRPLSLPPPPHPASPSAPRPPASASSPPPHLSCTSKQRQAPKKELPVQSAARCGRSAAAASQGECRAAHSVEAASVSNGLSASREPPHSTPWPSSVLVRSGACTRPGPLRHSATRVSATSGGVAPFCGGPSQPSLRKFSFALLHDRRQRTNVQMT